MTTTKQAARTILKRSASDPLWFFRNVLGIDYVTPQQLDVIASVREHKQTAVTAGHGVGKTWLAARLALWMLYTNPGCKVVTTAPTWRQVEKLLWRNLATAYSKARYPLGGTLNQVELKLEEEWFAVGVSTNESARVQGFHAPTVFVIFDEATGIDADIWEAATSILVGANDRWLAIGNPIDPSSTFKQKCDSGSWNQIELSSEHHPNVLENRLIVPGAVTAAWVREREEEYGGRNTDLYRSRVRGLWPESSEDSLIPLTVVEKAMERWKPERAVPPFAAVGCDVARFGADETVIAPISKLGAVAAFVVRHGQDTMATAGQLRQEAYSSSTIGVDDAGVGGGVTDSLMEAKRARAIRGNVVPVNAGSGAIDDRRFVNLRAEMWWSLRDALIAGDISIPGDAKLKGDLTTVKYRYDSRGRILIEPKDDIKKRLGRSPDRGDALAIANWVRVPRGPSRKVVTF